MAVKDVENLRMRIENLEFMNLLLVGIINEICPPELQKKLGEMNNDFINCQVAYGSGLPEMPKFHVNRKPVESQIILNGDIKKA